MKKRWMGLLLAGLVQAATAQQFEDTTAHQRFACLQREKALEPLGDKKPGNDNQGLVRLKLRFVAPDRPPKVEVLRSARDDDMNRLARKYVEGYRLPCLEHQDHPVEVVQEFSFSRWGSEPAVPLAQSTESKPRFAVAKGAPRLASFAHFVPGKALVELTFQPGQEKPELKFIFNAAGRDAELAIREYMAQHRLLDGPARTQPVTARQTFSFVYEGSRDTRYRLKRDEFSLVEFLKMTANLKAHPVDFDLGTMACPFDVRINLRQPYEPNGVFQIGDADANRAYLLAWLSKLQLNFPKEDMQMDLYGTDVLVRVPCGRLNLAPTPEKTG
jgi:hypothetical protein